MKNLSKPAMTTFNKLLQMAELNENYIKIGNTDDVYMPVSVEVVSENEKYKFVSIAHYYEQNGDLMADPEVVFAVSKSEPNQIFPIEQKMDGLGINRTLVTFENGVPAKYSPAVQYDVAVFCTMWFRNIKNQQKLN